MQPVHILISAYRAQQFIEECLSSIPKGQPILLGIDGCKDTLDKVRGIMHHYPDLKVFWYPVNSGPYVTFNSLLTHVPKDGMFLTFGADDIMFPDMVGKMAAKCPSKNVHDGVVCLKKEHMALVGGFRNWRMGADSDLLLRLARAGVHPTNLPYLFHYRQHEGQLTKRTDTGMDSEARKQIIKEMEQSTDVHIPVVTHLGGEQVHAPEANTGELEIIYHGNAKMVHGVQGVVSASLESFEPRFVTLYGLEPYTDADAPLVIFGMYRAADLMIYRLHRGPVTVVWCGSDAKDITDQQVKILQQRPCDHVATSAHISESLLSKGIDHRVINMSAAVRKADPVPRGECIYFYGAAPGTEAEQHDIYGESLLPEIEKRTGLKVLRTWPGLYTPEELKDIYARCFIGLRLTRHDGLPTTVAELGLMGRKSIFNGNCPHAISWTGIDDICESILKEYKNRKKNGTKNIALDWLEFIDIGNGWILPQGQPAQPMHQPSVQHPGPVVPTIPKIVPLTNIHEVPKAVPQPTAKPRSAQKVHTFLISEVMLRMFQSAGSLSIVGEVNILTGNEHSLKNGIWNTWWQLAFDEAASNDADIVLFLPDRYVWDGAALASIIDAMPTAACAINPIQCGRQRQWFEPLPEPVDMGLLREKVCFVDEAFILNRAALEALQWKIDGSHTGVGRHLSQRLNDMNIPIYRVGASPFQS